MQKEKKEIRVKEERNLEKERQHKRKLMQKRKVEISKKQTRRNCQRDDVCLYYDKCTQKCTLEWDDGKIKGGPVIQT